MKAYLRQRHPFAVRPDALDVDAERLVPDSHGNTVVAVRHVETHLPGIVQQVGRVAPAVVNLEACRRDARDVRQH